MLYVTTRITDDAFTANHALTDSRGPQGGFFVPMRMPHFDLRQIKDMGEKPFSQNVADMLNLLFGTKLDGWAVEFGIGRYPVKLVPLSGKITVAECWHNPVWRFDRLISGAEKAIRQSDQISKQPSDWLKTAVRIAVMFGSVGMMLSESMLTAQQSVDVSVSGDDLTALMAVWYARNWGLPISTIICCCSENSILWSFLHKGELRTEGLLDDEVLLSGLERLIFATLGAAETVRFCDACRTGTIYKIEAEQLKKLRSGIYVSVVSEKRMASTIPNLYKTTRFIAAPRTALVYSGLINYRAAVGESRPALIMSEESPAFSSQFVAECMGTSVEELKKKLESK